MEKQPFWSNWNGINELDIGPPPLDGVFGRVRAVLENEVMNGIRMDAWLWAARFFRTRTLAKKACELGRIQANGNLAKAAREVRVGDMLRVTNEGGEFEIEVLGLSELRGPAVEAQKLYRETEASKEMRQKVAAERRAAREFEVLPAARPSKRDRRRIIQFRGRG